MTTDGGLKGLTDRQWLIIWNLMDDAIDNEADGISNTKAMAAAARAWLAANVHDSGDGVDENAVFRMACWLAERDGCDDVHHLIWEGSPPEPWGEVWHKYEDDARQALKAAILAEKGNL